MLIRVRCSICQMSFGTVRALFDHRDEHDVFAGNGRGPATLPSMPSEVTRERSSRRRHTEATLPSPAGHADRCLKDLPQLVGVESGARREGPSRPAPPGEPSGGV